jgi:uncharacterized membrane protein (UPF0127 family)
MQRILIRNPSQPTAKPIQVDICKDFISRLMGLMFRRELKPNSGIVIDEKRDSRVDSSIHMLFMRFDIAVIWIDSAMKVVDIQIAKKWQPWLSPAAPARYVLETHTSLIDYFKIGDRVEFIHD